MPTCLVFFVLPIKTTPFCIIRRLSSSAYFLFLTLTQHDLSIENEHHQFLQVYQLQVVMSSAFPLITLFSFRYQLHSFRIGLIPKNAQVKISRFAYFIMYHVKQRRTRTIPMTEFYWIDLVWKAKKKDFSIFLLSIFSLQCQSSLQTSWKICSLAIYNSQVGTSTSL